MPCRTLPASESDADPSWEASSTSTNARPETAGQGLQPHFGTRHRELLDRILIINQQHALRVLHTFEEHYNDHRPHRTLGQAASLRPLPDRTRAEIKTVRRCDRLGGLLHEYQQVA